MSHETGVVLRDRSVRVEEEERHDELPALFISVATAIVEEKSEAAPNPWAMIGTTENL
jgi:hypothetical protein